MIKKLIAIFVIGLFLLTGLSTVSVAQTTKKEKQVLLFGDIKCNVYDARLGIAIQGASLVLQSEDKTINRFGFTNQQGFYSFVGLPSDHEYQITASKKFFTTNTCSVRVGETVNIPLGITGGVYSINIIKGRNNGPIFKHVKVHVVGEDGNAISSALVRIMQCNDLMPPSVVDFDLTNIEGYTKWFSYVPSFWGNWIEVYKKGYNTTKIWDIGDGDWDVIEVVLVKKGDNSKCLKNGLNTNTQLLQFLQNHATLFFIFKQVSQLKNIIKNIEV